MKTLSALHADIDARVSLIRSKHPDWLCRRGCEGCCHRLAEIPQLTAAEWALLREGLSALPQELLQSLCKEVAMLAEQQTRPITALFAGLGFWRLWGHLAIGHHWIPVAFFSKKDAE